LQQVEALGLQATLLDGSEVSVGDPGEGPLNPLIASMGGEVRLNGNAIYDDGTGVVTLTADAPSQLGAVMSTQQIDLRADFSLSFNVFLGANDGGADGLAFVLHNDPLGAAAIGGGGGRLGAAGLADGVALEFDTWQNGGTFADIANDHAGWFDTDTQSSVSTLLDLGNIEDGAWHEAQVAWNAQAQTLSYSIDGIQGATLAGNLIDTYFGGSDFVYFGFTGSTGGATNLQQVEALGLQATLLDGSEVSVADFLIA
jgi:hypothetical protein